MPVFQTGAARRAGLSHVPLTNKSFAALIQGSTKAIPLFPLKIEKAFKSWDLKAFSSNYFNNFNFKFCVSLN